MTYNIYEFEKWLLKNNYFYFPKESNNRGIYISKDFSYIQTSYTLHNDIGNITENLTKNEIIELYNKFLFEKRIIKINIIINE
jgi:hypothetical protein